MGCTPGLSAARATLISLPPPMPVPVGLRGGGTCGGKEGSGAGRLGTAAPLFEGKSCWRCAKRLYAVEACVVFRPFQCFVSSCCCFAGPIQRACVRRCCNSRAGGRAALQPIATLAGKS
eukprot:224710-Chlamydomonas_euryale.AAC.2